MGYMPSTLERQRLQHCCRMTRKIFLFTAPLVIRPSDLKDAPPTKDKYDI